MFIEVSELSPRHHITAYLTGSRIPKLSSSSKSIEQFLLLGVQKIERVGTLRRSHANLKQDFRGAIEARHYRPYELQPSSGHPGYLSSWPWRGSPKDQKFVYEIYLLEMFWGP